MATKDSIDTLLRRVAATKRSAPIRPVPTTVGRYRVGPSLGYGGLGLVHRAWDPTLGREVALKFVRPDRTSTESDGHLQARLRIEGRALAQLAHPNVVPVFDVGEMGGQVYIVLQRIEGRTLRRWLGETRRSPVEILFMFQQAGEGLAAAHSVGVIHRDFKPDNVLVDGEGRPMVVDFGLARAAEHANVHGTDEEPTTRSSHPTDAARLTESGVVMGTRGYIAPELRCGDEATARSDQYAFCVALREAMAGDEPRWLRPILARGLDADPERRWPSMSALLAALRGRGARRRWRFVAAGAAIAATVGIAWGIAHEPPKSCSADTAPIAGVWNEEVSQRLLSGIERASLPNGSALHERLATHIDARVSSWRNVVTDACQREAFLDPRLLAATQECLQAQRDELAALVDVLSGEVTTQSVHHAIAAVPELPSPTICADERWLPRHRAALDPEDPAARTLWRRLWHARALRFAGRYPEARTEAAVVVAETDTGGLPALRATALVELGRLWDENGEPRRAAEALEQAYYLAIEAGVDDAALQAATMLVHVVGHELRRDDESTRWGELAASTITRLRLDGEPAEAELLAAVGTVHRDFGRVELAEQAHARGLEIMSDAPTGPIPLLATLHAGMGSTLFARGRYAEAEQNHRRSVELRRESSGDDHPSVAIALGDLGATQAAQHHHADAGRSYASGLEIAERALGRDHLDTARLSFLLATALMAQARYPEAADRFSKTLAVFERTLGPEHPDVASILHGLSHAYRSMRRFEEAEQAATRALTLLEQTLGAEHLAVATALGGLATLHLEQDQPERALPLLERAVTIRERRLPPDHPDIAMLLTNLGNARFALGDLQGAERNHDRAIAILEHANERESTVLAYPLWGRARDRRAQGRVDEALADAERALVLRRTGQVAAWELAESQQQVAELLWESGSDRQRALSLARTALDTFVQGGETTAKQRGELEAWLANVEHSGHIVGLGSL